MNKEAYPKILYARKYKSKRKFETRKFELFELFAKWNDVFQITRYHFIIYDFKIGDVIYTHYTADFGELMSEYLIWRQLNAS